jgi:hypothetical protein
MHREKSKTGKINDRDYYAVGNDLVAVFGRDMARLPAIVRHSLFPIIELLNS